MIAGAMNELRQSTVQCPYCGETIEVLIDCSIDNQDYIEDCQVCCRPINFSISLNDNGDPKVRVAHEDQ